MNKAQMLESVRSYLSEFGEPDERILRAMDEVDRKNFVPVKYADFVYEDEVLPTSHGQTISQPRTVARMLSLLELKAGDNVLEVGAGSGWNARLIGYLVNPGKVLSLERIEYLAERARRNNSKVGVGNVEIRVADFRRLRRTFDKIIFTAGIRGKNEKEIIRTYARKRLRTGGILVCPYESGPLIIMKKVKGNIKVDETDRMGRAVEMYRFVRLVL